MFPALTPDRPVLDLPIPKGWKTELGSVVVYIQRWFTCFTSGVNAKSSQRKTCWTYDR